MKKNLIEKDLEEKQMKDSKDELEEKKEDVIPKTDTSKVERKKEDKTNIENIKKTAKHQKGSKEKFRKSEDFSEKTKKEMNNIKETKKKKWIVPTVVIGMIILVALFISTIFAIVNINNEKIISGVSIKGIDVSGLTKEEAKAKLDTIYNEKKEKEIDIKYQEYESSLNPTLMEVNFDTEKAADEAYLLGKGDNIFVNNYNILVTLLRKKDINVEMTLNEEVTKQTINDIGVNLPGIVIESSYSVEDDKLIITKGTEGIFINTDKLLEEVKKVLNDINKFDDYIEIPVIDKKPEEINLDKIHEEVYKEVKDAYYTKDPFTIYPEVIGVDFNVEEAKAMISAEDKQEYTINLIITKPNVTINQIGTEAFPDQLATFPTRYDATAVDRTTNLKLACQKINGKVILPGETFSYNQTLGPRTVAAGYKNAKVYENGQVIDGIGGGICQISSTLYNAALMANLEIVERRNHQFVTSYLPAGRDATVVYGMTDFKFKNTRQYPIKLSANCQNGIATVSIFGIKEENEYTFTFSTKTIATIPYTTKYIEDATLAPGVERVKQKGANGLKTETYIIKSLNGKVVSTKLLSKDTYDAMTRIVLRGKQSGSTSTQSNIPSDSTTIQVPTETTTPPTTSEPDEQDPEQTTETLDNQDIDNTEN